MGLTVLVTSPGGREYRLGPDEPDARWIPQNIQWSSTVPGGWKDCTFDLARPFNDESPLRVLDEIEVIDESGQTMYEGRIMRLPRDISDTFSQGVTCLGWSSHFTDDPSFQEIYVDRDMSAWGEPSASRLGVLFAANFNPSAWSTTVAQDPGGNPAVLHSIADLNQPGAVRFVAESWYDSQGVPVGSLGYSIQANANLGSGADTTWVVRAVLADDDVPTNVDLGTDHNGNVGPVAATVTATGVRKYALLQTYLDRTYTGGPTVGGWATFWRDLAVYGTHGLGGAPGPDGVTGFYIDDMLAHALSVAAPKLNFTRGPDGSIQRPPLVVNQAAFKDPDTVDKVLLDLNKYVIWDWLVYENKTVFYRPTDPNRLTWECRISEGARSNLEGDDAEKLVNGVVVSYSLLDGTKRTAGPVGSGLQVENSQLGITDPDHAVNAHGYKRKWLLLDVAYPLGDDSYAAIIGASALAQAQLPARSGSIDLTGYVRHPTKGLRPCREIRAGDWIVIADIEADVPRRIVQASYSENDMSCKVEVGNEIDKVSAMLEQVGIATKIATG